MPVFNLENVSNFTAYYAGKLSQGLAAVPWKNADRLVTETIETLRRGKRVFAFGNGGSYAIATAFLLDLKERVPKKQRRLIAGSPQVHEVQGIAHACGFDALFAEIIEREGQPGDLAVLVSSSSASINVLAAVEACKKCRVQSVLVTNTYTPLAKVVNLSICLELDDQQPGEDLSLAVLRTVSQAVGEVLSCPRTTSRHAAGSPSASGWTRKRGQPAIASLVDFVRAIDVAWLDKVARQIVKAYFQGHRVFLYAPSGGVLSVVAEHIAHNLQWDALMFVNAPGDTPRMQIQVSSISNVAHVTGVSNDRSGHLFHGRQLMFEGKKDDSTLLLTTTAGSTSTQAILGGVRDVGMNCHAFIMGSDDDIADVARTAQCLAAPFSEGWLYEIATQVLGHLLGRTVRGHLYADGRGREGSFNYDQLLRRELKEIDNKAPGTRDLNVRLGLPPDCTGRS